MRTPELGKFVPLDTSTPKSAERPAAPVPEEGASRALVRSPEERDAKAHSFYDNHHQLPAGPGAPAGPAPASNDLWVGYGCV